jgi:outer membrane protein OmpA-like peptidoglycan-associated protein
MLFLRFTPIFGQNDIEGSKDPELFTRMPNYYIAEYKDEDFAKFDFWLSGEKYESVEGRHLQLYYVLKENVPQTNSGLQITRNYINALKKIGGQLVKEFEDGGTNYAVIKLVKGGKEVWAQVVSGGGGNYNLDIIQKQTMSQDVVADANSMLNSIKETGKVALYGIYFDSGKSVLKPESTAALTEIAKLMKSDPSLKVYVVGHTDNAGAFDANMKLSMDRASAVVSALTSQYTVNAASLKACGNGPTSPVATNDTEEGKALNRRVELVKQ